MASTERHKLSGLIMSVDFMGDRMRVRRSLAGLVAASSVVAGATALPTAGWAAAVGEPCVRENLRLPSGSWQRFGSVIADATGRFQVAYATDTSWNGHLVRWDNGQPTDLGQTPGYVTDINGQGDIVGGVSTEDGLTGPAWRYSDGAVTFLPGLPGSSGGSAVAIAPDGSVTGSVSFADGRETAVVWAPDNTVRALPDSGWSRAVDIDADGTVIGYVTDAAVRWAPGAQPGVLPAYEPGPDTHRELTAISAGRVLGQEHHGSSVQVVEWAPGANPVSFGAGWAQAINARGSIVYRRAETNELWFQQGGVDRALPFGPSSFPIAEVTGLTDDDIAYGRQYSTPVRWVCA
jgi:hypothetical protein